MTSTIIIAIIGGLIGGTIGAFYCEYKRLKESVPDPEAWDDIPEGKYR